MANSDVDPQTEPTDTPPARKRNPRRRKRQSEPVFLDAASLADRWSLAYDTVLRMRKREEGADRYFPPACSIANRLLFRIEDVERYEEEGFARATRRDAEKRRAS